MPEITEDDLLQCIIDGLESVGIVHLPLRPVNYGVTVREFSDRTQCSMQVARKMLQKGVKKGALEVKKMSTESGGCVLVFYPKLGEQDGH